jgi:histidyl-tRNA synthetase
VAMNHGQLTMPFKRYQVQPVWRADRPQKGRYREFYQCDADIVGSASLLNEVELTNIYFDVFRKLGIPVEVRINSRKILAALAEVMNSSDRLTDITVAIDKLDKIGLEKVKEEMVQKGMSEDQIKMVTDYLTIEGSNITKYAGLKELIGENATGQKGIEEIHFILEHFRDAQFGNSELILDPTLARGLNYYTGIIFEVKAKGVQMGSIGGGGRYDDLTGLFGVPNIPGVGISFGVDRIYDVMEELKLFPEDLNTGARVLFFNLGKDESKQAYSLMQQARNNGIAAELFHEQAKMDKQFKYAEKKNIPIIAIVGSRELQEGTVIVKTLATSQQHELNQADLISFLINPS